MLQEQYTGFCQNLLQNSVSHCKFSGLFDFGKHLPQERRQSSKLRKNLKIEAWGRLLSIWITTGVAGIKQCTIELSTLQITPYVD